MRKINKPELTPLFAAIAVIVILCLINVVGNCQTLGLNGNGFFENRTQQSDDWIAQAVKGEEWALRIPGGAIAKFADPFNVQKGWGLSYEGIDSILDMYASSEEEDITDAYTKWRQKADAQPNYSYLDDVVDLVKQFPKLKIIYCANVFIDENAAVYPIDYLISKGVNVVAVELGNETYSQFDYDFNRYWDRSEPLAELLRFKGIPVYHPVPALGLRNSNKHQGWVDELNKVIDARDGVCFHPYYDQREFPALQQPVDTAAAYGQIAEWDFNEQFQSMKLAFKNTKKFIVTESNTQPSKLIGDTPLNSFFVSRLFEAGRQEFEYFCLHNGVAPDKYGIIYGANGKPQKRNTSYYSFAAEFDGNVGGGSADTIIENCRDTTFQSGYTYTTIPIQRDTIVCIKRFLRKKICFRFTYIVGYDTIKTPVYEVEYICDTTIIIDGNPTDTLPTDTIPQDTIGIQPLDADTLIFHNEIELRDWLRFYGKADYDVHAPLFGEYPCSPLPDLRTYPQPSNDDYMHPERRTGLPYGVIFDHDVRKKYSTILVPSLNDSRADFCNVVLWLTNPTNGQVLELHDIFLWWDERGENLLNINKIAAQVWGFRSGVVSFGIDIIHIPTGYDYTFLEGHPGHETMELRFEGIENILPK